jgi:hypothetical protein
VPQAGTQRTQDDYINGADARLTRAAIANTHDDIDACLLRTDGQCGVNLQ